MSFHKFTNLGQKFNSDLQGKVMRGITDEINRDRHCNCNIRSKADRHCQYDNNCRKATVVYELKCLICDMDYIGKTQRYVKIRTKEHVNDVWKVIDSGRKNKEKYKISSAGCCSIHLSQQSTMLCKCGVV